MRLSGLGQTKGKQMTEENSSVSEWKLKVLRNLDTRNLIERVNQYTSELEQALRDQAVFKEASREYLTSGVSSDCQVVKRILAELAVQTPASAEGKRLSVAEKESWLHRQRTENEELASAINQQQTVAFQADNHEIKIEMARRRLEGTRAILALRTAQLNFLAG